MSFYVVASPIGNLEDISIRALKILKSVDFILSEDTRVSKKLLDHYNIDKKLISFHHHSGKNKYDRVLKLLKEGKSLAFLSDAGTPAVSDPGGKLVSFVRANLSDINIEAIPGPSAVTTALSVSGIKADKFLFLGFLPHKKGRLKAIREALESKYPVVLYESKHRILKLLKELKDINFDKNIIIFRELTKMHYTFYEKKVDELYDFFDSNKDKVKGEFTLIIY
jgi:16S rRNA (cytidine1402-2'-O)-methyltransferase